MKCLYFQRGKNLRFFFKFKYLLLLIILIILNEFIYNIKNILISMITIEKWGFSIFRISQKWGFSIFRISQRWSFWMINN